MSSNDSTTTEESILLAQTTALGCSARKAEWVWGAEYVSPIKDQQ